MHHKARYECDFLGIARHRLSSGSAHLVMTRNSIVVRAYITVVYDLYMYTAAALLVLEPVFVSYIKSTFRFTAYSSELELIWTLLNETTTLHTSAHKQTIIGNDH